MSHIIKIGKRRPEAALEGVNRLTGLDFQRMPESLVNTTDSAQPRSQKHADETQNHCASSADFPQRVSRNG